MCGVAKAKKGHYSCGYQSGVFTLYDSEQMCALQPLIPLAPIFFPFFLKLLFTQLDAIFVLGYLWYCFTKKKCTSARVQQKEGNTATSTIFVWTKKVECTSHNCVHTYSGSIKKPSTILLITHIECYPWTVFGTSSSPPPSLHLEKKTSTNSCQYVILNNLLRKKKSFDIKQRKMMWNLEHSYIK